MSENTEKRLVKLETDYLTQRETIRKMQEEIQMLRAHNNFERDCLRAVTIPMFSGTTNPFEWVTAIEKYFEIKKIESDQQKLRVAFTAMEGPALSWYKLLEPNLSWNALKNGVILRFGPFMTPDPHQYTIKVKQNDNESVRQYRARFEQYSAPFIAQADPQNLTGAFLSGLSPHIQSHLVTTPGTSLSSTMDTAQAFDERNNM